MLKFEGQCVHSHRLNQAVSIDPKRVPGESVIHQGMQWAWNSVNCFMPVSIGAGVRHYRDLTVDVYVL